MKSTLASYLTHLAQLYGAITVWADVEGTTSEENIRQLGVDPSEVFVIEADESKGEVATIGFITDRILDMIDTFKEVDVPILLVWDSLALTPTDAELEDNYNPNTPGTLAKAVTQMTRRIGQAISNTNIAFVILNQARDDMNAGMFPVIKSVGGKALEHWSTIRLEVQKASQIKEKVIDPVTEKEEDEYVGHIFRIKTKKSKVSTPNREAETYLISLPYKGLDFVENVYRTSVDQYGYISKGAWRRYQPLDEGEEVLSLRHKEWVPFLESEEGQPILEELFIRQMLQMFPEGYAPFDNEHIDVKKADPLMAAVDKAYKERAKQEKEEAKKEKEETKKEAEEKKDK